VDRNVLHVLNRDRSLMMGTGGWSYTLNRTECFEVPGELALALARPSLSYSISPLATGASVFGVFEGRTPCRGISRMLQLGDDPASIKAKWRVTLFQDPDTEVPTTYKVEGSLFWQAAREGKWTIERGTESDSNAIVYRLEPSHTQPAILLLKGDDNVLFFLDQDGKPMVGHAEFSYTLNRRDSSADRVR
jgi:hypothetical protein